MTHSAPVRRPGTGAGETAVEVTVVIPVYGPGPHLERVVGALRRQQPPVGRIVVSHSGAGDPSARFAGADGVTVLHAPERLYAGAARNRGLALATTEWVAFVDEDVIVDDGWHTALQDAIGRGEADCIVGSIGYAETGGYWGMSLWFSEFGSFHPYRPAGPISSGGSGNMVVRRSLLLAVGAFPSSWRAGEELLSQARMEEMGNGIYFQSAAVGRHVNLPGLRRMLRHAYPLGKGSAAVRFACPHLTGAKAVRWPVLSLGLWLARLAQIYGRVFSSRTGPRRSLLVHSPGVLVAVLAWNAGFTVAAFQARYRSRLPSGDD